MNLLGLLGRRTLHTAAADQAQGDLKPAGRCSASVPLQKSRLRLISMSQFRRPLCPPTFSFSCSRHGGDYFPTGSLSKPEDAARLKELWDIRSPLFPLSDAAGMTNGCRAFIVQEQEKKKQTKKTFPVLSAAKSDSKITQFVYIWV